jgi:hypothetical protein
VPQAKGRQLQPRRPALKLSLPALDLFWPQVEAHGVLKECGRLIQAEAQVLGAQLQELAPGTITRQRQGWVGARRDGEVQPRRQMIQQEGQALVDRGLLDQMIVVEN